MMYNYPFYNSRQYYYPPYYMSPYRKANNNNVTPDEPDIAKVEACEKKEENREDFEETSCFEILGLKLYFDDILIICLIFFLYNEEVKDYSLFLALVLLLLS